MAISFVCDCGKPLRVKEELAGKKVRCPACKEVARVPAAEQDEVAGPSDDQPHSGYAVHEEESRRPEPPKRRRKKKAKPAFQFPWRLVVGIAGAIGGFVLLALILTQLQSEQSIGPRGVSWEFRL
ncbi:MAG: hypothetical protein SNJ82_03685 [Gemmataceae bacterium]